MDEASLNYLGERLGVLAECIDRQKELVSNIVPLIEETKRLMGALEDQAEELMLLIDDEKKAVSPA